MNKYPMRGFLAHITCCMAMALISTEAIAGEPYAAPSVAKVGRYTSAEATFRKQVFANPATMFLKQRESFTQLQLNATAVDATSPQIVQLGKGGTKFGFDAETFTVIDEKSAVWGKAYYTNGDNNDVTWNETSDYALLYPYVMGDGIGGKLDYEEYYLGGGYSARHGRFSYGGAFRYRARSEYRTVDPRPKNVVADLMARIGFGIEFGRNLLSVSASAGKYKQTNELAYFNELGASKEYHMTGLGNDFARFSGANNNTFYKGTNFGGSIEWIPADGSGFTASICYNRFSFEKILTDLNRLPLNKLHEDAISAEFAWKASNYGLLLNAGYTARRGNDNMFGDAAGNIYPQIGSVRQFESNAASAKIAGYYFHGFSRGFALTAMPAVGLQSVSSSHLLSDNKQDFNRFSVGVDVLASFIRKRSLIQAKAGIEYGAALSSSTILNKEEMASESSYMAFMRMARYFDSPATDVNASLRYDFAIRKTTLFAEAGWKYAIFLSSEHSGIYEFKIGMTL